MSADGTTYPSVRAGESVVAVARADPSRTWKTHMCSTPVVVLCALPPFWWALPCICGVTCGEAGGAKSRARTATVILTDKCIYVEGDRHALMSRIPLDELGNITTAEFDTCLNTSDPDSRMLQIFTRGNATPVYQLPCVKNVQSFINQVLETQTAFVRRGASAVKQPQPHHQPQQAQFPAQHHHPTSNTLGHATASTGPVCAHQPAPVSISPDNPYFRFNQPTATSQPQNQQQPPHAPSAYPQQQQQAHVQGRTLFLASTPSLSAQRDAKPPSAPPAYDPFAGA